MPHPWKQKTIFFTRPLKLEVHVRYWTTALRIILPFKTFKDQKSAEQIRRQFSQNWESLSGKSIVNCGQFSRDQFLTRTSNFSGRLKQYCLLFSGMGHCYVTVSIVFSPNCEPFSEVLLDCRKRLSEGVCPVSSRGCWRLLWLTWEASWDISVSRGHCQKSWTFRARD